MCDVKHFLNAYARTEIAYKKIPHPIQLHVSASEKTMSWVFGSLKSHTTGQLLE